VGALLDRIEGPENLKGLTVDQLEQLAAEIRAVMVRTVGAAGGHLAPSLGVVELTLALHTVFDSPKDKIVWDVGHQSYAHKLVTGRARLFHTLRQAGGISGFPRRAESAHDLFETGHASTSISAALGFAKARDLLAQSHHVIAVIGDGALTGGLALEGLNNAGHDRTRLIVVLNDNSMSIAPNVGALSAYLSRVRSDPAYSRVKGDVEQLLQRIPLIGGSVRRLAERAKDSLKYLLVPGMLFEELGFTYLGPLDGHNVGALQAILRQAKKVTGPVLVHVITKKGRGYAPAEERPATFHGTGPFDVATGVSLKRSGPTYSSVFGETLCKLARKDPRIVAITAAMPDGTGLRPFQEEFPDRCFDVGIAEGHAVTFAAGLAAAGMRPVVAVYSTFLQRAFDQIVHDVCQQQLPVVFAVDRAGLVGEDGRTHHGFLDLGYLRQAPHMTVMACADEVELRHMLWTAVCLPGPSAVRFPRGATRGLRPEEPWQRLTPGRARLVRRGGDIAVWAVGSMVAPALEAAAMLSEQKIEAAVVDARFVKPLDEELLLAHARDISRLLTVEENSLLGGFGSAVGEVFARRGGEGCRLEHLGLPDHFMEHGRRDTLLEACGLDAADICRRAASLAGRASRRASQRGA